MKITSTILIRSFVKPFYRQHAGFFTFLFIILFGAVGRVDGAGLFDFHFSLIRGMLHKSIHLLPGFIPVVIVCKKMRAVSIGYASQTRILISAICFPLWIQEKYMRC